MKKKKCEYQKQDSSLTLREGIEEYYRANPHLLLPSSLSEKSSQLFYQHDKIHVLFGCDTSFLHEARTDFWTMLGTDIGVLNYLRLLASPTTQELYKDLKQKMTEEKSQELGAEIKKKPHSCAWGSLERVPSNKKDEKKMALGRT